MLQLLSTKGNILMTEACMGFKGYVRKCKITKKMFLLNDLLQLCLEKNGISLNSSQTPLFFMIKNSCCEQIG